MVGSLSILLSGCAHSYSYRAKLPPLPNGHTVCFLPKVAPVAQKAYQCGPASLQSVFRFWGDSTDADQIARDLVRPGAKGILNFTLVRYAKEKGFWTDTRDADESLLKERLRAGWPTILMLDTGLLWLERYHFVVVNGFDEVERVFYANTGEAETQAISYKELETMRRRAGHWSLLVVPPELVQGDLTAEEANELAILLEKNGHLDLAERRYRLALEKNPKLSVARFNLANIFLRSDRTQEAEEIYLSLLAEKRDAPNDQDFETLIRNNLAWVYVETGRPREAIETIEAAFLKGARRRYDMLDTLGVAYLKLNDLDHAGAAFQEAMALAAVENPEALSVIQSHLEPTVSKTETPLTLQRKAA